MQLFKTRYFSEWAIAENLPDDRLRKAIDELSHGLHDGNLGSFCYKKRIGISGRSKSKGARLIIAFQIHNKAFFVYGYAKNAKENITEKELAEYKKLATMLLNLEDFEIESLIRNDELIEILK